MKILLISLSLLALTSCRMYDREYLTSVPVPEVKPDTLTPGDWNDPIRDTLCSPY